MVVPAAQLSQIRGAVSTYLLPDTVTVTTTPLVDDGEGGYTAGTPVTTGPYPCFYRMGQAGERLADGHALQEATPLVDLPALTPVDQDDTITVTITETAETIRLSVTGFTKFSNEFVRTALCNLTTPQDLT